MPFNGSKKCQFLTKEESYGDVLVKLVVTKRPTFESDFCRISTFIFFSFLFPFNLH